MSSPIYIAVEGVIGVGKTTLASLLQPEYEAQLVLEVFEENPFLPLFYADPERYAFQTQIVFLMSRYHQQRALRELVGQRPLVSDYLFAKDRLFAQLNLAGHEWDTYDQLHQTLAEQISRPDLVIYLRARVDTLMARIAHRGRPYEQAMPREYIERLAEVYDDFFGGYDGGELLTIESDDLDYVNDPAVLSAVRRLVRKRIEATGKLATLPALRAS